MFSRSKFGKTPCVPATAVVKKRQHVVFLNFPGTPALVAVLRLMEEAHILFVDKPLRRVMKAVGANWTYMQDLTVNRISSQTRFQKEL